MSLIQRVEIEGFRSVGPKQVIDLSKPGLILLTGDNRDRGVSSAAGKSTIFKAITTCLFEENDDDSIKRKGVNVMQPDAGLRIAVNFLDDANTPYCAIYTYGHPTEGSDWGIWRWNGTKWCDEREEKKGDTKGVIQQKLRMDYGQFVNRAYMAQETVAEFIWRTQMDRMRIFSGILDLGIVDAWVKAERDWKGETDKALQAGKGKVELLSQQIAQSKAALKSEIEIEEMREALRTIDTRLVAVDSELETKREAARQIASLIDLKSKEATQRGRLDTLRTRKDSLGHMPDGSITDEMVKDARSKYDEADRNQRAWEVKLQTAQAKKRAMAALGDQCGTCEQPIDSPTQDKLVGKYEDEEAECRKHAEGWKTHRDKYKRRHEALKEEYDATETKRCEHHRVDGEIRKEEEKLATFTHQIDDIRSVLGDAVDYPDRLNEEFRALADEQVALHRDRSDRQTVLNAAEAAKDTHNGLVREQSEQMETNAELEERLTYLKKVDSLLGDRGFKSYKIKSSRTAFNRSCNRYLSVLTDGEIEAELVTEVPTADGKKTKHELDILVRDGAKNGVPIRQYSGGEKGTLSLAITGSFWDLSSQQSSGSVNLLLLDEPFANMDPWQIEKGCSLLASMRESGRTILVVTNQQSVRDRGLFDREIRAIKENHITRFEEFDLSSNH